MAEEPVGTKSGNQKEVDYLPASDISYQSECQHYIDLEFADLPVNPSIHPIKSRKNGFAKNESPDRSLHSIPAN